MPPRCAGLAARVLLDGGRPAGRQGGAVGAPHLPGGSSRGGDCPHPVPGRGAGRPAQLVRPSSFYFALIPVPVLTLYSLFVLLSGMRRGSREFQPPLLVSGAAHTALLGDRAGRGGRAAHQQQQTSAACERERRAGGSGPVPSVRPALPPPLPQPLSPRRGPTRCSPTLSLSASLPASPPRRCAVRRREQQERDAEAELAAEPMFSVETACRLFYWTRLAYAVGGVRGGGGGAGK